MPLSPTPTHDLHAQAINILDNFDPDSDLMSVAKVILVSLGIITDIAHTENDKYTLHMIQTATSEIGNIAREDSSKSEMH